MVEVCPVCALQLGGGVVEVDGKRLHPKCFFCQKCAKQCRITYYKTIEGKNYCQDCVDKTPELYHTLRNQSTSGNIDASGGAADEEQEQVGGGGCCTVM